MLSSITQGKLTSTAQLISPLVHRQFPGISRREKKHMKNTHGKAGHFFSCLYKKKWALVFILSIIHLLYRWGVILLRQKMTL